MTTDVPQSQENDQVTDTTDKPEEQDADVTETPETPAESSYEDLGDTHPTGGTREHPDAADEAAESDELSEGASAPGSHEVPPVPQPSTPAAVPSAESRNKGVFAHLSAFVTLVGIPAPIGPLVAWLVWRDQDEFAADQAREALNFNISFLIYGVVAAIAIFVLVGFLLLPAVVIGWFVLTITAAIAASRGETYRYPLTIRFLS